MFTQNRHLCITPTNIIDVLDGNDLLEVRKTITEGITWEYCCLIIIHVLNVFESCFSLYIDIIINYFIVSDDLINDKSILRRFWCLVYCI